MNVITPAILEICRALPFYLKNLKIYPFQIGGYFHLLRHIIETHFLWKR